MRSAVERRTQSDLQNPGQPKNLAVWQIGIPDQDELNPQCLHRVSNPTEAENALSLPMLKASQQVQTCKNAISQALQPVGEATHKQPRHRSPLPMSHREKAGVRECDRSQGSSEQSPSFHNFYHQPHPQTG